MSRADLDAVTRLGRTCLTTLHKSGHHEFVAPLTEVKSPQPPSNTTHRRRRVRHSSRKPSASTSKTAPPVSRPLRSGARGAEQAAGGGRLVGPARRVASHDDGVHHPGAALRAVRQVRLSRVSKTHPSEGSQCCRILPTLSHRPVDHATSTAYIPIVSECCLTRTCCYHYPVWTLPCMLTLCCLRSGSILPPLVGFASLTERNC